MDAKRLETILAKLKGISVLVLGDFFLDKYLMIEPALDEPSIETGLTAYQVTSKKLSPGAAGTVTNNLVALGVGKLAALGVIADDGEGYELTKALRAEGVDTSPLIMNEAGFTPTYMKPMRIGEGEGGAARELNRVDIKNRKPTPRAIEDEVIAKLRRLAGKADAIVVMDQVTEDDCGTVTQRVRDVLAELGRKYGDKLVIYADSRNSIHKFSDIIIKCNEFEVVHAFLPDYEGVPDDALVREYGAKMSAKNNKPVFVTRGSRGQMIFEADGSVTEVPAISVEGPIDIVGAGDSASAGIVSAMCAGANLREAAVLANVTASITIQQLGTTGTATPAQVMARFREFEGLYAEI